MENDFDQINVIPLVDVLLVLLTIVLTSATFVATGKIPVDLSKAESAEPSVEDITVITIAKEGKVYLDDVEIGKEQLAARLDGMARTTPILLRADKALSLDRFVTTADMLYGRNFTAVSLEVER